MTDRKKLIAENFDMALVLDHLSDGSNSEFLEEFVNEANEHLSAAEEHLLRLEKDPSEQEAMNALFRAFHTIKGVAGFLDVDPVKRFSHEAENLLDRVRQGEIVFTSAVSDVTFTSVDVLTAMIDSIRNGMVRQNLADQALETVVRIIEILTGSPADEPATPESDPIQPVVQSEDSSVFSDDEYEEVSSDDQPEWIAIDSENQDIPTEGSIASLAEKRALTFEEYSETLSQITNARFSADSEAPSGSAREFGKSASEKGQSAEGRAGGAAFRESVRVDSVRLDRLVDTIGELVIAESMVSQAEETKALAATKVGKYLNLLDKITRELQELATSLRMMPVKPVFQKMARLVRDLSRKAGKKIEFTMSGEEIELDKTVIEKIGDPLVHMIRNSVDHGIEPEALRLEQGKPATGNIHLQAYQKEGGIYLEITDDGKGLVPRNILRKAIEKGIVDESTPLTDREILHLIFEPGFSTAEQVTEVSGRGVGMDVVRRNIEELRGKIDIESVPGEGCKFTIGLPLTLAIIDGMVLKAGSERYIIPTLSVLTLYRPAPGDVETVIGKGELLKLHGELIPIHRLASLYYIDGALDRVDETIVVVIESDGKRAGIMVDELLGQQQVVIKSLGESMQGIPGLSGGAIMPDGQVGLILDAGGIVRLASGSAYSLR